MEKVNKSKIEEMSNMEKWALIELKKLEESCTTPGGLEMQKAVTEHVMRLVKVFSNEHHSGHSAGYTLNLLKRILKFKPILPLTGEEDEWGDPLTTRDEIIQQNRRCSSVFRANFDNTTAYDIDGKVFSDDGGKTWFSSYDSRVKIEFPYIAPESSIKVILEQE